MLLIALILPLFSLGSFPVLCSVSLHANCASSIYLTGISIRDLFGMQELQIYGM